MLRISPRPSGARPYGIPADNPLVHRAGARPEIWAYGLRNPWRYSFDRTTGDLWIGDVGQIRVGVPRIGDAADGRRSTPLGSGGGQNYGWNRMEGSHPLVGNTSLVGAVPPVFEYSHDGGGCVVTGGYVYRGSAIPDLEGAYVFADFCLGRLEALQLQGAEVVGHRDLGPQVADVSSFGQDASGSSTSCRWTADCTS